MALSYFSHSLASKNVFFTLKGHPRSFKATNRFLPISFDWKDIERWGWLHCVWLIEANRLICNMIYFGHHVTLTWGQSLTLTFRNIKIHFSKRMNERNTIVPLPTLYLCWFKRYSWKKQNYPKTSIFTMFGLWRLNRWPGVNFDDDLIKRRVQKLSIAFRCVFLAILVPEIPACFLKNIMTFSNFWPLMTSGDLNIALRWKMTEILSNVRIESNRMLLPRLSSPLSFWVRGGWLHTPPPLWRSWPRPPLGRGLNNCYNIPCPYPHSVGAISVSIPVGCFLFCFTATSLCANLPTMWFPNSPVLYIHNLVFLS